jgi:hypothetical protein
VRRVFGNGFALDPAMINEAERERIRELCTRISEEHDRGKLLDLILELSLVIEAKNIQSKNEAALNQLD